MSTLLLDWNAHRVPIQEVDIISETTTNINADLIPKYFRKLSICTKIDQKFGVISLSSITCQTFPFHYHCMFHTDRSHKMVMSSFTGFNDSFPYLFPLPEKRSNSKCSTTVPSNTANLSAEDMIIKWTWM